VTVRRSAGGNGGRRRYGVDTPEALARRGSVEFDPSYRALREAVEDACSAPHTRWEEQLVAGVEAALRFAATEPAMAHALLVQGRRADPGARERERELIAHFGDRLRALTPESASSPPGGEEGVIQAIVVLVRGHLRAGTIERIPKATPDLVYLALLPYMGVDGARSWAGTVAGFSGTPPSL
jgi:hypothetical protein